jgi:hypothetical protein
LARWCCAGSGYPAEVKDDFGIVQGATLTLLALLMDSRCRWPWDGTISARTEEEEANAIGTEYLRADLIEGPEAEQVKALLVRYLDQRILYYRTRDSAQMQEIEAATSQIEDEMWKLMRSAARETADHGPGGVRHERRYQQPGCRGRVDQPDSGLGLGPDDRHRLFQQHDAGLRRPI